MNTRSDAAVRVSHPKPSRSHGFAQLLGELRDPQLATAIRLHAQQRAEEEWLEDGDAASSQHHERLQQLPRWLGGLTLQQRRAVALHFGLDASRSHSLREISTVLGVTPRRAKRLVANAIHNLRRIAGVMQEAA